MKKIQNDIVAEIVVWIEQNIHLTLRIDDVVLKSGYSKFYFQRLFYEYTGVTMAKYIRELKLRRAADALAKTDVPIVKIAHYYGYESQQTFTRNFTQHYRISPAKWRKHVKSLGHSAFIHHEK